MRSFLTTMLLAYVFMNHSQAAESALSFPPQPTGAEAPLSASFNIGDYAEGGVIFWLTSDRQHGLVCAVSDVSASAPWEPSVGAGVVGASADGIDIGFNNGNATPGLINTNLITTFFASSANPYAAKLCSDYSVTVGAKTYDDWYLPSLLELQLMMANRAIIDATALSNGGAAFQNAVYWSSLELNTASAITLNFLVASAGSYYKNNAYRVRAVRSF